MHHNYSQKSNWINNEQGLVNTISIDNADFIRLDMAGDFHFSSEIIATLKDIYKPDQEQGGLIYFRYDFNNGVKKFTAVEVKLITNVSTQDKRVSYLPASEELDKAYLDSLTRKLIPISFHTHPTIYPDSNDDLMIQGLHFIEQLNTSIADHGATRWWFTYNKVNVRLPDLLILENNKGLFIGFYGGLIAPLGFKEYKEKAMKTGMDKVFNSITELADTPGKKIAIGVSALAALFLAFRYPKASIPLLVSAGIIVPPMIYASQETNEFFTVALNKEVIIHIPKLPDAEIIKYEVMATQAQKEAKRIADLKKIKQIEQV